MLGETNASGKDISVKDNHISNCVNGIRINADIDNVAITGNLVEVDTQPLYVNYADYQLVSNNTFIGGTSPSNCYNGSYLNLVGNVFDESTASSYTFYGFGANKAVIVGNSCQNSTANIIRYQNDAIAVGNTSTIINGTPTTGAVYGRNTTANRPTLSIYDGGTLYFDTTLAGNGQPIWWTGYGWVDSSGTTV